MSTTWTRRELLELGLAGGLSAGVAASLAASPQEATPTTRRSGPRNVIFMVADGMSLGVPSLAEPFARLLRAEGTHWRQLLTDPRAAHGFFETHSLSSLVTDSAAASTAWASGTRVFNGALNVLPDKQTLVPIGRLVRETGRRLGLVTTTTITHATPAGFAAVQPRRDDEDQIAPQYLDLADVLLGGGTNFFDPAQRADKRDLRGEFAAHGYALWSTRTDVTGGAQPDKVLGLFGNGHLPFTIDQQNQADLAARVPTLAEMTAAALAILSATDAGFLLQVEGGRVDHAAHGNDAAAMLHDQLAFDDALGVVLAFAARQPDTLVIVTSDHGNSNPGLNGMGGEYRRSTRCFARLAQAKASLERLHGLLKVGSEDAPGVERIGEIVHAQYGLELTRNELEALQELVAGKPAIELSDQQRNFGAAVAQLFGNHTGLGFTGVSHTADYTLLSARGPGAERFAGVLKNTAAFEHLTALLGITHRNPEMTADQAAPLLAQAPVRTRPDWA
jgi:alkaline phosphatase